jgi:hypothetical protein
MDLATLANVPRPFAVGGAAFPVSALTQREWAAFQGWVREYVPRPDPPPEADRIERSLAARAWPPAIGSAGWVSALDHPGCFPRLVQVALGKHADAPVGDDAALGLAWAILDEGTVGELIMLCLCGERWDPASAPPPDPDAAAPLPESDSPGAAYFEIARKFPGWTHQDILDLTFPQVRYYRAEGRPLAPGRMRFGSSDEAREYRNGRMGGHGDGG